MGKLYGPAYDPTLRQTEHGVSLYNAWRTVRRHLHCEEWEYFPNFYDWSLQNGYELGSRLRAKDPGKPFGPDNCEWFLFKKHDRTEELRWIARWNKTVNCIRKHYGLPLLGGDDDG